MKMTYNDWFTRHIYLKCDNCESENMYATRVIKRPKDVLLYVSCAFCDAQHKIVIEV